MHLKDATKGVGRRHRCDPGVGAATATGSGSAHGAEIRRRLRRRTTNAVSNPPTMIAPAPNDAAPSAVPTPMAASAATMGPAQHAAHTRPRHPRGSFDRSWPASLAGSSTTPASLTPPCWSSHALDSSAISSRLHPSCLARPMNERRSSVLSSLHAVAGGGADRWGNEADLLVVPQRGGAEPTSIGDVPDAQGLGHIRQTQPRSTVWVLG